MHYPRQDSTYHGIGWNEKLPSESTVHVYDVLPANGFLALLSLTPILDVLRSLDVRCLPCSLCKCPCGPDKKRKIHTKTFCNIKHDVPKFDLYAAGLVLRTVKCLNCKV